MEDMIEVLMYVSRFRPQVLEGTPMEELLLFFVTFMGSPAYIKNPYLRSRMVEVRLSSISLCPWPTPALHGSFTDPTQCQKLERDVENSAPPQPAQFSSSSMHNSSLRWSHLAPNLYAAAIAMVLSSLCAQVLSQWMPMDEEPRGRGAWGRRRTPQAAASVLLLIDSHPLVLNHMVSASCKHAGVPLS